MSWRVSVSGEFCAAHALRNYHGKCERLHGHNFKVEVTVAGNALDPATGMLLDFTALKRGLRAILERLDHQTLAEVPPFDRLNPSSENLARHIWDELEKLLPSLGEPDLARLHSVTVSEKETQWATYLGPGEEGK